MAKNFYIFRHGETDYNLQRIWQGQKCDTELNQNGIEQACGLAERLAEKNIEIIFSSPLKRANKTADILAEKIEKPKFVIDALKEACLGELEGLQKEQIVQEYGAFVELWYDDTNLDSAFPGGESKCEVAERFLEVLTRLARDEDHQIIGISTHSAMIRCLMLYLGFSIGKIPNTAVYNLKFEDETWSLVS